MSWCPDSLPALVRREGHSSFFSISYSTASISKSCGLSLQIYPIASASCHPSAEALVFLTIFFLVGCSEALLHGLCACLVLAFCLFPLCHQWILVKSESTSLFSIRSVACIRAEGFRKVQSAICFTAVSQPLNHFLPHSATLINDWKNFKSSYRTLSEWLGYPGIEHRTGL